MRRAHTMVFGSETVSEGMRFALWAPTAQDVRLVIDGAEHPLPDQGEGWRRLTLPDVRQGARYGFRIDGDVVVPDPASRFQPGDVDGPSEVIDPNAHAWSDGDWRSRPWEEAVVYELHVGTFSPEGTYAGLEARLDDLVDLGITAIELLPLADFKGTRNWGYDCVLPFAPDASYGRPEDLKRLVEAAHAKGLMVLIDCVYNHFGPAGNYLHSYAKSFFTERHETPWGAGINFDGEGAGRVVRDFFIANALYWLEEYHFDGIRFDAVHAILDDSEAHFLQELAVTVRTRLPGRHVHLILENEANQVRWLTRGSDRRSLMHDAQWADDWHHCWHVLLTGEASGYYASFADRPLHHLARCLSEGFAYQGEPFPTLGNRSRGEPSGHLPPTAFVNFLQNHDQVGNRALGERLSQLVEPGRLALARACLLLSPQIPMLWMGEEWSATTPFQFFVDFAPDEALNRAVREGRRREFKDFAAFADDTSLVPDPTARDTFERSKLDWAERELSPHREVLADTSNLLQIRRQSVVPLLRERYHGAEATQPTPGVIEVAWAFESAILRFVVNLGGDAYSANDKGGQVIWSNALKREALQFAPWTGAFLVEEQMSALQSLADLVGIATGYRDAFGTPVDTSLETRRGMLAALGFSVGSEAEIAASLAEVEAVRRALVPPLLPAEARRSLAVPVLSDGSSGPVVWRIVDERGQASEGRATITMTGNGPGFELPPLTPGYHRLSVAMGARKAESWIIAAPQRCWRPRAYVEEGARDWGLAAQLYGLRSPDNLGIGSYADAGRAAHDAGLRGASFLGLSPVHALFPTDRTKISPYSPSSRLFLETLYIEPGALPGFEGSRAAALLETMQPRVAALRDSALVDHAGIWEVLSPVLEAFWQDSAARVGTDRGFAAFRTEAGENLVSHATFEALSEHFKPKGAHWLGDWSEEYRRGGTEAVHRFAKAHDERIAYHAWLQYCADRQLRDAAAAALDAGMRLGLYRDLAVGADRGGSELWSHPERFANGVSIGAPPDQLAPKGQDWGLPAFHPLELERGGLQAFRDLVRANVRHAGAIRIDHAFQLARLFLIPLGQSASAGGYVAMPFEPMLAVLRLESHRNKCLIIAEDLGTAPEGFSDALMAAGVLSYRILAFEREHGGAFKPPEDYPHDALTAITTHDLPTFVGWWRAVDTDTRQSLGLYDADRADAERRERVTERHRLSEALWREQLLPTAEPPEAAPFEAAARYLARAPSILTAVQYEDVVSELSQANVPGSTEGYPNWRRKLDRGLEAIAAPGGPLAKLAAALSAEDRGPRSGAARLASAPPRATYRLQFHEGFGFAEAQAIVPYLASLGISHVYASPIQAARPGSRHGYDIVDHGRINPEIGGEEGFRAFSDTLRAHGLKLLLDIVPNHMGVGGADNPWWLSVLEWGGLSPFAHAFDIDWDRLGANGKLVIPFLAERYGDALEKGTLELKFDERAGAFSVWHYEHEFPICPLHYPTILNRALAALGEIGDDPSADVLALSEKLRLMGEEANPERRRAFPGEAEELKQDLAHRVRASPQIAAAIYRALQILNGNAAYPDSFGPLHRLLEAQSYRLAHWRIASSDINYRRFFDVNALAGLRVEKPDIFHASHALLFRLVAEGRVDGFRIDHIDGLADPFLYARELQSAVGPGFYVVVEKILEKGEKLRPWPVAGTTGYDVLNQLDGIFVDRANQSRVARFYEWATGIDEPYGFQLRAAKSEILEISFASELEVLCADLKAIADADRKTRDFSINAIRRALIEIIARFPTYRSYLPPDLDESEVEAEDVSLIEGAVAKAKRWSALPDRSVHDFAARILLGRIDTAGSGRPEPRVILRFRRRFQQLTGPVMAKSLEDTLFYRYVPLLGLNEVGGDPGEYGLSPAQFHALQAARARDWPNALITSSTHDTKRGEDARARLLALSELPEEWARAWDAWRETAGPHLWTIEDEPAPDVNDQWLLFQAILGAWPLELFVPDPEHSAIESFRTRLQAFGEKALRESKRRSSWVNVDEAYEDAVHGLLDQLIQPGSDCLARLRPFAGRLAHLGVIAGLARTVLKCTLPGIPDVYQGAEFWDFSFVDPDNRRPVDFSARAASLEEGGTFAELLAQWPDGRIKQALMAQLLSDRAGRPSFYAEADYHPVEATGACAGNVLAFLRSDDPSGEGDLLVAVPRLVARLTDDTLWSGEAFCGTTLPLPEGSRWTDIVDATEHRAEAGMVDLGALFATLPLAVLRRTG